MRYHKPSLRTLAIITDASIPRRADGHVRLCTSCQRRASWRGGFLTLIAEDLELLARIERLKRERDRRIAAREG